jgi:hypothetical protein
LVISSQTAPSSLGGRFQSSRRATPSAAEAAGMSVRQANALLAEQNTCIMRLIRTPDDRRYRLWLGFADMTHFGKKFQSDVRCLAAGLRRFL